MPKYTTLATIALGVGTAWFSAQGQTTTSGSISLDSLSLTPTSGDITWSSLGWSLYAESDVYDSATGFNSQFQSANYPGTASATASIPNVTASTSATANSIDTSQISASAIGSISLPALSTQLGMVGEYYFNVATLETQFYLSQNTSVTFAAGITVAQTMQTDAAGYVLDNSLFFGLGVDYSSEPNLFYYNSLQAAPNTSYSTGPTSSTGSTILNLSAGPHDLYLEVDSDQLAVETSSVPDQASTFLLLLAGLGSLAAVKAYWPARKGIAGSPSAL